MSHAVVLRETGGPEKLRWEEWPVGKPGPGEVRMRHTAVGLNFIDVYQRTGVYQLPLPAVLGQEGAGVVLEAGPGVSLKPGTRVAYAGPLGAYAEERIIAADRLVLLPDWLSDVDAAGVVLKGLTAEMLLRRVHNLQSGEAILFTAAAGGVGQIACRWAKALGATVIGTVGSSAKVETARAAGCDHVLVADAEGLAKLPARVREITKGKGVRVAYDSVAGDSLRASLDSLAPRGLLVVFGQSSGTVPKLDFGDLANRGSLYATRPTLRTYLADPAEVQAAASALFDALRSGHVRAEVRQKYPLRDAGRAHADLEARRTTGATVLLVG
jgi:NADPH2:quinone reductase